MPRDEASAIAMGNTELASLYFGMAVRIGLECGLFRPPAFADKLPLQNGSVVLTGSTSPWVALEDVPQDLQRQAMDRERTYLLLFVIDR